jgi:cytochrome c553
MRRPTRRVYSVSPVLLLVALTSGTTSCTGRFARPTHPEAFERTKERLERGEYLVNAVLACGMCHATRPSRSIYEDEERGAPLSGGNIIDEHGMRLWVPNITPDKETGIGSWSDDELLRALRDGVRPDGQLLVPAMPFDRYATLSDEDARAVVVYLKSLPAVRGPGPREPNRLPFPTGFLFHTLGIAHHKPVSGVTAPPRQDPVRYGAYLANLAVCAYCHSRTARGDSRGPDDKRFMAGADRPFESAELGKVWPSNLTPDVETGIGKYSEAAIKQAIETGMLLNGKTMAPPMHQARFHYTQMNDDDLHALITWLKSLKPVHNQVPARQLSPAMREHVGSE